MARVNIDNGGVGLTIRTALNNMFTEIYRIFSGDVAVNVTEVQVNDIKVLGDRVAAIGLDAMTDSQKITAIISALRAHGIIGPNA